MQKCVTLALVCRQKTHRISVASFKNFISFFHRCYDIKILKANYILMEEIQENFTGIY